MDHLAIMKKEWGLIPKILSGEKTVETRWYRARYAPWDRIRKGENVYFKDVGGLVTAVAEVAGVEQYEVVDDRMRRDILNRYVTRDLGTSLISPALESYTQGKRYAIVIFLIKPSSVTPFDIDKKGFGAMAAWLVISDISVIQR